MRSCPKTEERRFKKNVAGEKFKVMVSPVGDEHFYDLREDADGNFNLEHGRIVFFESGEEVYDKMVGSRST